MLNEDLHHTDVHRPDLRFSKKLSSEILTIQAPGRCTRGTCSELFMTMDWSNILSCSISHLLLTRALCFWSTSQVHRELIIDLWRDLPFWDAKYGQLFNYVSSIISFISSQRIWSNEFEEDLTLVQQLWWRLWTKFGFHQVEAANFLEYQLVILESFLLANSHHSILVPVYAWNIHLSISMHRELYVITISIAAQFVSHLDIFSLACRGCGGSSSIQKHSFLWIFGKVTAFWLYIMAAVLSSDVTL